jgi:hypothetical protein
MTNQCDRSQKINELADKEDEIKIWEDYNK